MNFHPSQLFINIDFFVYLINSKMHNYQISKLNMLIATLNSYVVHLFDIANSIINHR